jgi:hypothetical protein
MGQIVLSTKDQRHRLDTELNHYELAAVGYVTVLWARLEQTILGKTIYSLINRDCPCPKTPHPYRLNEGSALIAL